MNRNCSSSSFLPRRRTTNRRTSRTLRAGTTAVTIYRTRGHDYQIFSTYSTSTQTRAIFFFFFSVATIFVTSRAGRGKSHGVPTVNAQNVNSGRWLISPADLEIQNLTTCNISFEYWRFIIRWFYFLTFVLSFLLFFCRKSMFFIFLGFLDINKRRWTLSLWSREEEEARSWAWRVVSASGRKVLFCASTAASEHGEEFATPVRLIRRFVFFFVYVNCVIVLWWNLNILKFYEK